MFERNEIIELGTFITIIHQHSQKPKPQSTILYSRNCSKVHYNSYTKNRKYRILINK